MFGLVLAKENSAIRLFLFHSAFQRLFTREFQRTSPLFEIGFPEPHVFPKFIEGDIPQMDLLINPAFVNAEVFGKGRNVEEGLVTAGLWLEERLDYLCHAMGDKVYVLLVKCCAHKPEWMLPLGVSYRKKDNC